MPNSEPPFDDFALAERSTPLAPVVERAIEAVGGRITFARFMELALGHPEHGYYARAGLRWGREGDFETSPEVHPVFGYLWARQILECWERLGSPPAFHLVEPGAGSGAFAVAYLTWLRERAPECFAAARPVLLDGHPRRVEDQRAALSAAGLEAEHVLFEDWLTRSDSVTGVVISNELFDAFPAHLVERRGDVLHEWYVVRNRAGGLAFELGEASTPGIGAYFERLGLLPGDKCRAEVSLAAVEGMRAIAERLARGYLLTIDYGYDASELYAPWRRMGTLMAFRNHSPQPDPLARPGLTDLTYHVDLTSLAAAAVEAGFVSAPPVSQAEALVSLGIGEALEASRQRMGEDLAQFASARRAVDTLLDPAGLGRIRVLAQAKGAPLEELRCLRATGLPG